MFMKKTKNTKQNKKQEVSSILQWKKFFNEKFNDALRQKQMLAYTWYIGDSDLLVEAYLQAHQKMYSTNYRDNMNSKTYFWSIASQENEIKKTHSGLPNDIIQTLINILGYPASKVMEKVLSEDGLLVEQENNEHNERLEKILSPEENDMASLLKNQQQPMTWVMGDGCYLINADPNISEFPLIEFVDARNTSFELVANRVIKVYTRSYYVKDNTGYMLLQERGTDIIKGEKMAYIKYNLFQLSNKESREISKEVSLKTIPETENLEDVAYKGISVPLAIPCIYNFEKIQGRGKGIFNDKMDLLDDLDQALSQGSNAIRLSTPVEMIDESLVDHDDQGRPITPTRYDRRFMVTNKSVNGVGQPTEGVHSSVPNIDFSKYSDEALAITSQIITGIISPSTIGLDVSKKDNGDAQREKEKQTMFTRANLIKFQTDILCKLYATVLMVDDFIHNRPVGNYTISIDYPEYGNPTFEAKLLALVPAFTSGAMSPEKFVDELWGDSLSAEDREKEIEWCTNQRNSGIRLDDPNGLLFG